MNVSVRTSTLALVLCPMLAPAALRAEDGKLTLSVEVRTRVEVIDNQFRPNASDTGALQLRTSLRAEYDAGPVRFGGEIMDSRAYFARRPTSIGTGDVNAFEPVQAYVVGELGDGVEVQAGRMTINFGSRRLVSRSNYRNATNAFTGIRLDWRPTPDDSATLFWTMPLDRLPNEPDRIADNGFEIDRERIGQQFFGAQVGIGKAFGTVSAETYLFRLVERDAPEIATRNRRLWTFGGRLLQKPAKGQFDGEIEAAAQRGTARRTSASADTTDLDVRAWFLHASVGYSFAAPWSPRLILSYDHASGDRPGADYRRFDTLFGARVFEYGPSSLFGPVARANLRAPESRLEVKPGKRADAYVAVRPLWLDSATDSFAGTGVRDAAGQSGRHAGTQIDVRVRRWLKPDRLRLAVGAALLAKGRFLTEAPNAPDSGDTRYGFAELTATF